MGKGDVNIHVGVVMRIFQLMDDQVLVRGMSRERGGNRKSPNGWQTLRGGSALQMHAAGADQRHAGRAQRLSQARLRHEALFANHRTGVALVDGVPEARPELRPNFARDRLQRKCPYRLPSWIHLPDLRMK